MTREKAIEILGYIKQERIPPDELDELRALNIAINAVEEILELHSPCTQEDVNEAT